MIAMHRVHFFRAPFCLLPLKSAVLFCCVFTLSACDEKSNEPVVSSLPTESAQPQSTSLPTPSQNNRHLLIRGGYKDFVLNPAQAEDVTQVALLRDLFEGLVIYDPRGNVIPAVAESWQTKDNKTWTFSFRQEAKWSNGEPVTAQQFVASWQALATSTSPLKSYLAYMNLVNADAVLKGELSADKLGIEAENDRTLLISLDKVTPYLPQILVHISLLPQYLSEQKEIITNGAYYVTGQENNVIHLEKSPHYWAQEKVSFKQVD